MKCTRQLDKPLFAIAVLIGGFFSALRGIKTITPLDSLSSAVGSLQPGDTLYLKNGSYGQIQGVPSGATSWANAITIASAPGESATINGVQLTSAAYVIFSGLTIDASGEQGVYLAGSANHIRFQNCEIKNGSFGGVVTSPTGSSYGYHEFLGCSVHDNGTSALHDHGFYLQTTGDLIDGCDVYRNAAFGIQLQDSNGSTVRNSKVHNNCRVGQGGGIVLNRARNAYVTNNQIYSNGGSGAYAGVQISNSPGVRFIGNSVYSNSPADAGVLYFGNSSLTMQDNDVHGNGGTQLKDDGGNSGVVISGSGGATTSTTSYEPPTTQQHTETTSQSSSPEFTSGAFGTAAMILGLGFLFVVLTD